MSNEIQLVECPRDAMQGWPVPIDTPQKIAYLQQLMQVGFDTLDCLSFVSAKAIPQMADSKLVAAKLDKQNYATKILAIVANERGAADALAFDVVDVLGYPFSISPTFQQLNANSTIAQSWERLMQIQAMAVAKGKSVCVYLSMGFGNPYGDDYDVALVLQWVAALKAAGIDIVSLADTVGLASPAEVGAVTAQVVQQAGEMQVGVHLHSTAETWEAKMEAAWRAGCRRFDGALKGIGGCPMANNALVGNMNTEWMIPFFQQKLPAFALNEPALDEASQMASQLFANQAIH